MISRLALLLSSVLTLACTIRPAPDRVSPLPSLVDEYVRVEMEKGHIPGLSVAVVIDGKVVLAKGYGVASLELPVPVTPQTVFQTASIGKQFTATAVMMLVHNGKVSLDDPISKYLGDVPSGWNGITVRHLLTHTAGLRGYPDDFDQRRDYTEDELLKIIQGQPLASAPGEKWEYSNAGYVTLGALIRRVTGMYYGDFFREKIFEPLGMNISRIVSEAAIVPNRAAGYIVYNGRIVNQPWIAPTLNRTADGSLNQSVVDLAKWDAALYGDALLPRAVLEQMWTAATLNDGTKAPYGFGWFVKDANGHRLIEHEGAWQGFNANIARYPDQKLTVIVVANLKSARTQMISHRIAGIYVPAVSPPLYRAIADTEPRVTRTLTDLLRQLAAATADPGMFTAEGRAAFFPATAEMYSRYLKPLGEPTRVQLVERSETGGNVLYRYEVSYMAVSLLVSMTMDRDDRIVTLTAVDNY